MTIKLFPVVITLILAFVAQASAATHAKLCNVVLRPGIQKYRVEFEKKFGPIRCLLSDSDFAFIEEGRGTIGLASAAHFRDEVFVTHELLHLWLGAKGWDVTDHQKVFHVPALPQLGGQLFINETTLNLEDYIEHRIITPIMQNNGIKQHKEREETVSKNEILNPRKGYNLASTGADYLITNLDAPEVGKEYKQFLISKHWDAALEAASIFDQIIESRNPRNQQAAFETVQACVDKVFSPGSKFLLAHRPGS